MALTVAIIALWVGGLWFAFHAQRVALERAAARELVQQAAGYWQMLSRRIAEGYRAQDWLNDDDLSEKREMLLEALAGYELRCGRVLTDAKSQYEVPSLQDAGLWDSTKAARKRRPEPILQTCEGMPTSLPSESDMVEFKRALYSRRSPG